MAGLIYAPATARGRAGIAVVRLSGGGSWDAVSALGVRRLPETRRLARRRLVAPDGAVIDDAMVVLFEAVASFTGEEAAELHLHGSVAVINAALEALAALPGARLAEPGEFARRAFENGRMTLAEIEGMADLIDAETEAQKRQAMALMQGRLTRQAEVWRQRLQEARALAEAGIEFADEELPSTLTDDARAAASTMEAELRRAVRSGQAARRLREGFEVVILGRPNAGKSTLINAIAGRRVAITGPNPGTTRDALEASVDLGGMPVTFVDTAGLREAGNAVEAEGVAMAKERAEAADLKLVLLEHAKAAAPATGDVIVVNRRDLGEHGGDFAVSALTGEGVEQLLSAIAARLAGQLGEAGSLSHRRHVEAVSVAALHCEAAKTAAEAEIVAEELRLAARALSQLVDGLDDEALLDDIFGRFCLGK